MQALLFALQAQLVLKTQVNLDFVKDIMMILMIMIISPLHDFFMSKLQERK